MCEKQFSGVGGVAIDFSKASLRRADFRFASLIGADLRGAELSEADFSLARLNGANMEGTKLGAAIFTDTDLTDASLCRADLRGADLSSARNLLAQQLVGTKVDHTTRLPSGVYRPEEWPTEAPSGERMGVVNWTPLLIAAGLVLASTACALVMNSHQGAVSAVASELGIESSDSHSPATQVRTPAQSRTFVKRRNRSIIAAAVVSTRSSMTALSWQQDASIEPLHPVEAKALPDPEPPLAPEAPTTTIRAKEVIATLQIGEHSSTPVDQSVPVVAFMSAPERNDRWIEEFVTKHYLSGAALKRRQRTSPLHEHGGVLRDANGVAGCFPPEGRVLQAVARPVLYPDPWNVGDHVGLRQSCQGDFWIRVSRDFSVER